MDLDRHSDEQLLAVARPPQAGVAFGLFYRRHERLVVAFHMRRTGSPELAADLTSETFAQALENRQRFTSRGEGSASAWLYGIARLVWLEQTRKQGSAVRLENRLQAVHRPLDDAELIAIERCAEDTEVVRALEALPPMQREAVRAYVLGELEYDEIAERLDCEPATVRKRVSRGLAALRGSLERT